MDNPTLWQSMIETWTALRTRFEPIIAQRCLELNLDLHDWGLLLSVMKFEPNATAPVDLMVRSPYTAAEVFIERLSRAAMAGWIFESDPGAYRLSESGREVCAELINIARMTMVEVDPLSLSESQKLTQLLDRLVQSSLNTKSPPNPWSLRLSYKLMPSEEPAMPFIEQGFTCLSGYREDAQLASWTRTGKSATALEMMALIWRGEVDSLDAICDGLAHRGHSCDVYVAVLENLRELGFVNGDDQSLFATGSGRVFCNQVEATTENLFFAPWSCLEDDDRGELSIRLERLKEGLMIES
jgi:hypothetical protein